MAEHDNPQRENPQHESVEHEGYRNWRAVELTIKAAAQKAAREAGPGISSATVDAWIRQARFDRFLSRVFSAGEIQSGSSKVA